MDPFLGSGTTQVQSILEGRSCIGCEIDADYYATQIRRIDGIAANRRTLDDF